MTETTEVAATEPVLDVDQELADAALTFLNVGYHDQLIESKLYETLRVWLSHHGYV